MKQLRLSFLAVLTVTALAACGSSSNVAYYPNHWGPAGYCYYLYSPYECYGHHYGIPRVMPLWWHERYAAYYDSPSYVRSYVPVRYRTTAYSRSKVFERNYSSAISRSSRLATWKGTNGKTVPGSKVSRSATFGNGGARSKGFSTGSPCAAAYSFQLVGFSSGRSSFSSGGSSRSSVGSSSRSSGSSRSYGGGSARSGSTGSRSGSHSSGGKNC